MSIIDNFFCFAEKQPDKAYVLISGNPADAEEAKRYITGLIERTGNRQNDRRDNQNHGNNRNEGSSKTVIEIDPSEVGIVIGRGGSKIKELQNKYNVTLNIGKIVSDS